MIVAYVLLVLSGLVVTVRASRPGGGRLLPAISGTALAVFAILTGFTIGPLVAAVAAVLLVTAGTPDQHRDRVA